MYTRDTKKIFLNYYNQILEQANVDQLRSQIQTIRGEAQTAIQNKDKAGFDAAMKKLEPLRSQYQAALSNTPAPAATPTSTPAPAATPTPAPAATPTPTPVAQQSATPAPTLPYPNPKNRAEAAANARSGALKQQPTPAAPTVDLPYPNPKNRAEAAANAAARGKAQTAATTPTATTPTTPSGSTRDEKTVQSELDAALKSGDQTKANSLFDELATVRKQSGSPNQPVDLLQKYPVAGDASSSQPGAPTQQPVAGTANKAGVYTPEQLAAFEKANKSTFDPKSRMDREKMTKMLGQSPATPAASTALPGAGQKPGQIKTPAPSPTATTPGGQFNPNAEVRRATPANLPPGYVERQNSSLPGIFGTASNMLGRAGDTARNIAMGTVGKVNPQPTAPPATQSQQKRPPTYQKAGR